MTATVSSPAPWTCPFCPLLCDGFRPDPGRPGRLLGSECPRAVAGLSALLAGDPGEGPSVDGVPSSPEVAVSTAAARLAQWRQPLFGGCATDVAGARALYRLAARCGAVCDHADGMALMHGVRAVQDRGQFTTTLGEVRERADLLVFAGTDGVSRFPEILRRCGIGSTGACRSLVFLSAAPPADLPADIEVLAVAGSGDLFTDLQQLAACVTNMPGGPPDPALATLAARLRAARYAVLVWEAGVLPRHGELIVEALNRIVGVLNLATRAATLCLGGGEGAATVNQVFTWLSGLPLRTRVGSAGLEHEPLRFGGERLVAQGAVDGLLWLSSFDPARGPPASVFPTIVLGPPGMARHGRPAGSHPESIFLPVATPGIDVAGHLFRTDGGVVVPLVPCRQTGLPAVADVLAGIEAAL